MPMANCSPHNNPANYIDVPLSTPDGRIRTTCRICGKWIGYRTEGKQKQKASMDFES